MFIAHGREIKFFATQQAMPLVQEGVAKGIAEEKKEATTDDEIEYL